MKGKSVEGIKTGTNTSTIPAAATKGRRTIKKRLLLSE